MSYLDKTFCGSMNCKNIYGRKMTYKQKEKIRNLKPVSYACFCDESELQEKFEYCHEDEQRLLEEICTDSYKSVFNPIK